MDQFGEFNLKISEGSEIINEAIKNCLKALKANKEDELKNRLGVLMLKIFQSSEKASIHNLAILSNELNSVGLFEKCNTINQLMVTIDLESHESWIFLGHSRMKIGLIEEAIQAFFRATDVLVLKLRGQNNKNPLWLDLANYYCTLAEAMIYGGKLDSALTIISKAKDRYKFSLGMKPEPAKPWKLLGDVLLKMDLEHGAKIAYKIALDLNGKSTPFKLLNEEVQQIQRILGED